MFDRNAIDVLRDYGYRVVQQDIPGLYCVNDSSQEFTLGQLDTFAFALIVGDRGRILPFIYAIRTP